MSPQPVVPMIDGTPVPEVEPAISSDADAE
jgi:hypothetical protein